MPAYLLAICEVTNPNDNFKKYIAESSKLLEEMGGKYVIRGPSGNVLKGEELKGKVVILSEWPDMDTLLSFANGPKYQEEIAPLREGTGNYNYATYEGTPPAGS